ncbi:hypothetical protein [Pseudomonas sp. W4I3]|uniref:hypothetical protein n=1 Tax=Pseudomonas sp. W4I3 TaxID=3042294 RepID=UPI0027BA90D0|nr:hypothetical protein [Pseudomonas sp. W4I3]
MTATSRAQLFDAKNTPTIPAAFWEHFVSLSAAVNDAEGITFTRDYCLKHSSTVATKLRAFTHGYSERYGMPGQQQNPDVAQAVGQRCYSRSLIGAFRRIRMLATPDSGTRRQPTVFAGVE